MGARWRRPLCSWVRRDPESGVEMSSSSNPSTPRLPSEPSSPSARFAALLKTTFRLAPSSGRCGVCLQRVKTGSAVFTAECSHAFHLSCIAPRAQALVCPVCSATWRHPYPLLLSSQPQQPPTPTPSKGKVVNKVYDDDEPLSSAAAAAVPVRFNAIPEEAEEEEEAEDAAIVGRSGRAAADVSSGAPPIIHVTMMPEIALVSAGRSHHNYVVALKVKASPPSQQQRSPVDLIAILDVTGGGPKLQTLKRAARMLISSLGEGDRLSMVAFSASAAKRLLPLTRMTRQGHRSARQIADRLIVSSSHYHHQQSHGTTGGASDALRKATKILEDRRERNPVATIMLLSDQPQHEYYKEKEDDCHLSPRGDGSQTTTRYVRRLNESRSSPAPKQFAECVVDLSVVLQDVRLHLVFSAGEISAVYSCGGATVALGGSVVHLRDLRAGDERELLMELRVPTVTAGSGRDMSVKCSYRDGTTQELIQCREQPLPIPCINSGGKQLASSQRLRDLFIATRAVADSRRLADDLSDYATAIHLLSSARALLLHSATIHSDKNLIRSLDAQIAQLQSRRQHPMPQSPSSHRSRLQAFMSSSAATCTDGREPLTPTSAWRAAERLAKLAIMRKSLNRISDLHGFENARF